MNQPFTIAIPQDQLDQLRERLARTRFPNVPCGAEGSGFPVARVRELVEHWRGSFDWRAVEARLNALNQRVITVDGLALHVVHERGGDRLPVVVLHGWPDTFFGVHQLIPPLTAAGHDVIVPSLPGYGFSGQTSEPMSVEAVATTIDTAVGRLGYQRYAVHGGDWGSAVAEQLALTRPDRVAAVHLLDVPYHHQFSIDKEEAKTEAERAFLAGSQDWDWGGKGGYAAIQSTQPLTLSYGLADSPAGLLAWIGEKYSAWTDREPDAVDVLTQASIYWFTNTICSSMRLYAEGMDAWDGDETDHSPGETSEPTVSAPWPASVCAVPAGFALHPADLGTPPRVFAERFFSDSAVIR